MVHPGANPSSREDARSQHAAPPRSLNSEPLKRPPTTEQQAREALGMPPEWMVMTWAREGKFPDYWGLSVEGGVAPPKLSGKHKGKPNWAKATMIRKVIFADAQVDAWLEQWERDEGLCHRCEGTGHAWAGWNCETGNRYAPCRRCHATGLPISRMRSAADGASSRHAGQLRDEPIPDTLPHPQQDGEA